MIDVSTAKVGDLVGPYSRLLRIDPYTRKSDGILTSLLTWEKVCEKCGEIFEYQSGRKVLTPQKFCKSHRRIPRARSKRVKS